MKERLDVLLVKRNLAESREKAKAVVAELKAMKLPEAARKVETGIEENGI